jgi:hypothetical protein
MTDVLATAHDEAADSSILRAERRLRLLDEVTDYSMDLMRQMRAAGGDLKAQAEALAPLSRMIRLTLAMEAKTDLELRNLKDGIVWRADEVRVRALKRRAAEHEKCKDRIEALVTEVIEETESEADYGELLEALEERLFIDPAYIRCELRPLRESVQRLCHDLMLDPDWSRWSGEGWVKDDAPPKRPPWSCFNTPSRVPLLNEDLTVRETPGPGEANGHDLE